MIRKRSEKRQIKEEKRRVNEKLEEALAPDSLDPQIRLLKAEERREERNALNSWRTVEEVRKFNSRNNPRNNP